MKPRFDDRIQNFPLPPNTTPCLTRRTLLGLLTAGAFAGLPRTARAQACSTGAFAHELPIASLSFFPDGNTLISAGQDRLVKFWTIPAGALFRSVTTDAVPVQLAVSPEGRWIGVAMQGGLLEIWSADGQKRRSLVGHSGTVNGVAFTADGAKLVSVSQDHTTRVWSVVEGKLLRTFSDTDAMNQVAVPAAGRVMARGRSPAQRGVLVTAGTQVYRRLLSSGAIQQTAPGTAFALSPDGQLLAAHDATRLYVNAFPSLSPLASLVDKQAATSLAFSADNKLLAVAYSDTAPRLYSAPDLTPIAQLQANGGPSLATVMDPQNRYVAVASDRNIYLYSLPAGAPLAICFMDLACSAPSSSGLQYFEGGMLYTLGCGESIPVGFACSCNCVPGNCPCVYDTGCACDSDTGCSCVSDTGCSCDSDTGCSCVGNVGCSCDSDYGCGCVGDSGCGCDGDVGSGGGCGCDGDLGF
jgi:WD40 repeat protein